VFKRVVLRDFGFDLVVPLCHPFRGLNVQAFFFFFGPSSDVRVALNSLLFVGRLYPACRDRDSGRIDFLPAVLFFHFLRFCRAFSGVRASYKLGDVVRFQTS